MKIIPFSNPSNILPNSFFCRPAELVAPDLIGCKLCKRELDGNYFYGFIVEAEAYSQAEPACHGYKRRTKINETLCLMARNLAGLFLVAMIVIVIMQIFFRYVLNDSLIWTEELAKTLMVWTAFLVAPWAYRAGANVRIGFLIDEFPKKFQTIMRLILNFLIIWIVTVFFYESFGFW